MDIVYGILLGVVWLLIGAGLWYHAQVKGIDTGDWAGPVVMVVWPLYALVVVAWTVEEHARQKIQRRQEEERIRRKALKEWEDQ